MAIYVLGDIHGQKDRFDEMLKKINFSDSDRMIILGDVIDRGPFGVALLQQIRDTPNMELMIGNHEDMMLRALGYVGGSSTDWLGCWYSNGGRITHLGLKQLGDYEMIQLIGWVRGLATKDENIARFVRNANGDLFYLTHGWPQAKSEYENRYDWVYQSVWERPVTHSIPYVPPCMDGEKATVIVGHTPTMFFGHRGIYHADNFIDIDCGCAAIRLGDKPTNEVSSACLGCLNIDTMEEIYV